MAISPDQWVRVKEILATALDLHAEERVAFLLEACSGDPTLLEEVRSLLAYESDAAGDHQQSPMLGPGTLLKGRYRIQKKLGEGGFATTFLAVDQQLSGRKVVVKVLTDPNSDPYIQRKFREELHALSILEHPHVIAPLDHGLLANGQAFLVTQFAEGQTLRTLLAQGPLSLSRTGNLVQQIGRALAFVHTQGVFHRDLKPENIVVQTFADGSDHARLIDFGIATIPNSAATSTRIIGSIAYMAPEQLAGKPAATSDIYALGILAYETLTGRVPFVADSPFEHAELQRHESSLNPAQLRPEIPGAADQLILKALRFEPARRPQDAGTFGAELKAALVDGSGELTPWWPRPAWLAAATLVIALVVIAAGAGWWSAAKHSAAHAAPSARSSPGVEAPSLALQVMGHPSTPWMEPDGELVLPSASKFRIAVQSSRAGHLYIFSETQDGSALHILFPSSTSYAGNSAVSAQTMVLIPEYSWFGVSAGEGTETLYIAICPMADTQLESALRWSNGRDRGNIADAPARDRIRRILLAAKKPMAWQGLLASLPFGKGLVVGQLTLRHG